jgi:hypothetical protein
MAPGDGMPGGPMPHGFFPVSLSVAQNKNDYFVCLGVDEGGDNNKCPNIIYF